MWGKVSDYPITGWGFFHVADSGVDEYFDTDGSTYYHQSMHTADGPVSVHGLQNNRWAVADSANTTGLFGDETNAFYDADVSGVATNLSSPY